MALLSELVAICEEQGVDAGATLRIFARRLRDAGRISKAGRGRGAAHMSFQDAARFLIACAATDHPERAVEAEFAFSNLVLAEDGSVEGEAFQLSPMLAPKLDQGLAQTLIAIADDTAYAAFRAEHAERAARLGPAVFETTLPRSISLMVRRGSLSARLRVLDTEYAYQHPTVAEVVAASNYDAQLPLLEALDREMRRFRNGKNILAELDADLLRAVAYLVAGKRRKPASPS